jgi:solute carrier family 24 (sodium/potassium/calcium exchanger), member 6
MWVLAVIIGMMAASFIATGASGFRPPSYRLALALVGFIMSILWIMMIADELVNLLDAWGHVLEISPAVLGLTVLAWGNSIGDLAANVSIAKNGYPSMAIAGCFAGPMFNLLIGVGISLVLVTSKTYPEPFTFDKKLDVPVTMACLALSLIFSLVYVGTNNFTMTKSYGVYLMIFYVVFLIVSFLLQFDVLPNKDI